jgi:hypothetical protein
MAARQQAGLRLLLVAALVGVSTTATAKERVAPAKQDWARVESLAPGRRVTVKRFSDPKVKGTFVSATPESVVMQSKKGQVTIAKDAVRTVLARRGKMRYAPWIGLGAGFALVAALTTREGDFVQPSAAFTFGAAGAGLGYLGGLAVRGIGQNALIYRSPKRAQGN